MNCADLEILICDYVDGTLDAAHRAEVEAHLAECELCAELAHDSAAAVRFMERAADVEPPPELVTRILFDAPWHKGANPSGGRRGSGTNDRRRSVRRLQPIIAGCVGRGARNCNDCGAS